MALRAPTNNEILAFSVQTAQGAENTTPATAEIVPFISCALDPNQQNLERADKGLGRTFFGYVRGGNLSSQWKAELELVLAAAATPVATPSIDVLLKASMGATVVSFNDTVQAAPGPTTTVFAVTSAATLKQNDIISVAVAGVFYMRTITNIAANTLTVFPALPAAPVSTAKVKSRIYRLATAPVYMTITNWIRATDNTTTAYSRKAIDAVVGQLLIDFNQSIIRLSASGPAGQVSSSSIATIPTLPSFSDVAQARNFGTLYWGGTALTAYELQITLDNGAAALPVAFGSQFPDGTVMNLRKVTFNLTLDAADTNASVFADANAKTQRNLFGYSGDGEGVLFGFNLPLAVLTNPVEDKGSDTVHFKCDAAAAVGTTTDGELILAIA